MRALKIVLQQASEKELNVLLQLYRSSSYQNPLKGKLLRLLKQRSNYTWKELSQEMHTTQNETKRVAAWLTRDIEWIMEKHKALNLPRELM